MIVVLGLGIVMLVCVVVLVALLLCNNSSGDEDDCRLACNTDPIFLCSILYSIFLCSFYSIDIILIQTEVRFVTAVTAGGSVKFFASSVNFSIFTHFLCFFLLKLLKLGEIDGVNFLT